MFLPRRYTFSALGTGVILNITIFLAGGRL